MENSFEMQPSGNAAYDLSTPQSIKPQNPAAIHQRTYQGKHSRVLYSTCAADPIPKACIPCRQRKVRCDLGSVDNPHDPPCVRCRREAKECFFSSTRRKPKKNASGDEYGSDTGDEVFEIKSGRKRLRASSGGPGYEVEAHEEPRTPGGSVGQTQPLRRPTGSKPVQYAEEDQKASEQTVGLLQAAEVHGGHDALKLLYEAAAVQGHRKLSKETGSRPSINGISPASLPAIGSPIVDKANGSYTAGPMSMLVYHLQRALELC